LQADGRTLGDRREDLDGKRRACDRAQDELRSIDLTLAGLPQDAPERATELAHQIETVKSQLQEIRESYQQDEAAMRAILLRGPYSSVAAAEERVRQLEEEYAEELLRVNAIKRLWDSTQKAKAKALEGLAEPVQQRATDILGRQACKFEGLREHLTETRVAMRRGEEIIYQGYLEYGEFGGYPDFLVRVERPSQLGRGLTNRGMPSWRGTRNPTFSFSFALTPTCWRVYRMSGRTISA